MEKRFQSSILFLKHETRTLGGLVEVEEHFTPDKRRKQLINKIEDIILHTVQSISSDSDEPTLVLRPVKTQWKNCNFHNRVMLKTGAESVTREIKYTTHKKRFDIIFNILAKIYHLLQTKGYMTKREIYYEHTDLFGSQRAVNSALSDICCLLDASPWELRVLSTSKGLVIGDLIITTDDCQVIDCSKAGGVLVPQNVKDILRVESSAKFILLVEKDAAFQKLLDDGAHVRLGPCIMITGKGEPDINTRLLVHRLRQDLDIPILIVVDADPYGIEIMCTYRFGSLALSQHAAHLAVAEVRWVGIHPTDIAKFSIPTVPLTTRDFNKARDLASRPYIRQNEQLLEQVNCLLESGRKSEIENLAALSPTFLTDMFLSYKITSKEVI